jgi:hypothetical protein
MPTDVYPAAGRIRDTLEKSLTLFAQYYCSGSKVIWVGVPGTRYSEYCSTRSCETATRSVGV